MGRLSVVSGVTGEEHHFYLMKETIEPNISDEGVYLFTRKAEIFAFPMFSWDYLL